MKPLNIIYILLIVTASFIPIFIKHVPVVGFVIEALWRGLITGLVIAISQDSLKNE